MKVSCSINTPLILISYYPPPPTNEKKKKKCPCLTKYHKMYLQDIDWEQKTLISTRLHKMTEIIANNEKIILKNKK